MRVIKESKMVALAACDEHAARSFSSWMTHSNYHNIGTTSLNLISCW